MSPATRTMFRSLRVRNYRLFAAGQVVSLSGTWMQRVAQDWLVLELTHNSGVAIGLTTALQFLPMLLFGLYGGVLADRYDKRRLLIGAQVTMGLLALTLGVLDVTGSVAVWHVYLLAFLLGTASVIDTPVRQAFVIELVGPADVANAVSLNSATFNSARIIGPAIAGVMISSVGTGWVFLVNAVTFVAVVSGLLAMRPDELHPSRRAPRSKGQMREGIDYVRQRPQLWVPIALVGMIGTFGLNFQLTLALLAKEVFHRSAASYGLMSTMLAVGSLLGALASARRDAPRARTLLAAALAFGVLELACGLAPSYWLFVALLVPTGAAALTFTTTANSTVQMHSGQSMRGRVMALYILVFMGGTPVGAPAIGWLAEVLGPRSSLLIGGVASALSALAATAVLARARDLRVVAHVRPRPHVHVYPIEREVAVQYDDVRAAV